jgi:hypothetical protein
MPMVVFLVGVLFKTEIFTVASAVNMSVVVTGIGIASYGGYIMKFLLLETSWSFCC